MTEAQLLMRAREGSKSHELANLDDDLRYRFQLIDDEEGSMKRLMMQIASQLHMKLPRG
ncbi:hypothetical protein BJ508DRAFT_414546 [Ascobolus immersus RN42]|uniref:Uncharacterized protein n=1 Tax=Ascobolus immersus RN42 TaxID=1160509 RepID=A0A3N4IJM3_ASCIM|nr:hypothetical protein BJ508DRAFT_414546 [Ascobolus immersus RN42]